MSDIAPVVILGASHAGVAVAAELRTAGVAEPIVLIGREDALPYHRPHLSKDSLEGEMPEPKPLRPETYFTDQNIDHRRATRVTAIDRAKRELTLHDGTRLAYSRLVIATGARARRLPEALPGGGRALTLRHRNDWRRLAEHLSRMPTVAVIGGGLIGLEVAAAARARGLAVAVIESTPRLMARSLYAPLGDEALKRHREAGIDVHLGVTIAAVEADTVRLSSGEAIPADLVLAAIGSQPRDDLAHEAGLEVGDGVVVDAQGQSSDPLIFALGDCASWADGLFFGRRQRHESVAAALQQAKAIAAAMIGAPPPPPAPLRLWSFQGPLRFQMVGPVSAGARVEVTALPDGGLLAHAFEAGCLVALQALNAPRPFNAEVAKVGQAEAALAGSADMKVN